MVYKGISSDHLDTPVIPWEWAEEGESVNTIPSLIYLGGDKQREARQGNKNLGRTLGCGAKANVAQQKTLSICRQQWLHFLRVIIIKIQQQTEKKCGWRGREKKKLFCHGRRKKEILQEHKYQNSKENKKKVKRGIIFI